jgi:uncharacterized protein (DUF2252 family)
MTARIRERLVQTLGTSEWQSPEASIARGVALREEIPFSAHAAWQAPEDRPDPVELIRSQGETRVQQLLPLRYERMAASPFTFYRGAALIMASDLSNTPSTGIQVQACGDAHISNFGLFLSPERRTVFDINDFDETAPGPWEWDVKRLAASVEICGRDNGFSKKQRKAAVRACVRGYREAMQKFATMGNLDVWYAHLDVDTLQSMVKVDKATSKAAAKILKKSKGKNSARAVRKLTEVFDGELRIVSDPPVIVPMRDIATQVEDSKTSDRLSRMFGNENIDKLIGAILAQYKLTLSPERRHLVSSYTPVDMAHKVVGVGSVGTRAWIIVLKGANENDSLVLQVKEAQESVLERFVGKVDSRNHGQRVVEGQRAMQTASDSLLGWCVMPDEPGGPHKDYYVRQLWDGKGSFDLSLFNPEQLSDLARACGATLAHAHARTGDRFAITAYLGESDEFDRELVKFARSYADQNEADYARFMQAREAGEL